MIVDEGSKHLGFQEAGQEPNVGLNLKHVVNMDMLGDRKQLL